MGGGLLTGTQTLTPGQSAAAKFNTNGYVVEGGVTFGERSLSLDLGAEIGHQDSVNQANGADAIETASLTRYGVKTTLHFGRFGFGGGARGNDISLKSLSPNASMLESKYAGITPFGLVNASFDAKRFRTTVEVQYASGSLTSKDASLPATKMNELTVGLHFYLTGE